MRWSVKASRPLRSLGDGFMGELGNAWDCDFNELGRFKHQLRST